SLFPSPAVLSNPVGQKLVRRLRQSGIPSAQLTPQLYRDLTLAVEPQGLGAVVRQQWFSISDVRPATGCLWLAVESIDSAGNLGTIIGTAEATGVTGIVVIGTNGDPGEHGITVLTEVGALHRQGIYGLGESFQRRSC